MARNSEVDAYVFIKSTLASLGWNTKNPARAPEGQVYTQHECHAEPNLKKVLKGSTPENVIRIGEGVYWVIEAKKEHRDLNKAVREAKEYAELFRQSKKIRAVLATGVAGNSTDNFLMASEFSEPRGWKSVTINGRQASGLFSPTEVQLLLAQNHAEIQDLVVDEKLFLEKAERINQVLHLGAINKNQRAKVMAALLLSVIDDTTPNIDANPRGLIRDINSRVVNVLEKHSKREFEELIKITLPPSPDNHFKFRKALVETIQELLLLNIRSAMNSGADVLGKFYEVFLKYGNGAKEIGIVLTPRHVTQWVVRALNIQKHDYVLDPTCGTGGFLVAAFDHVKTSANEQQLSEFKKYHLFGVEQEAEVVALAIVNMIFRGDGKNNIVEGNCFQKHLARRNFGSIVSAEFRQEAGKPVITKVLMNPPFALKSSDDKEFRFVQHALDQMEDGGILFSVLPISVMSESGEEREWRSGRLLKENTLLSVVTFPPELFYPVGVHTLGVFVKKGTPHNFRRNVLWSRCTRDGFIKRKGKRLPSIAEPNQLEDFFPILRAFIGGTISTVDPVPMKWKCAPINKDDELLELVPEAYLDSLSPTTEMISAGIEQILREQIAFLIRSGVSFEEN